MILLEKEKKFKNSKKRKEKKSVMWNASNENVASLKIKQIFDGLEL